MPSAVITSSGLGASSRCLHVLTVWDRDRRLPKVACVTFPAPVQSVINSNELGGVQEQPGIFRNPRSMMPDSNPSQVSLLTFVSSTPIPVVRLLVELAPVIHYARQVAEVISWTNGRSSESWLAVSLWWTACLSTDFAIRSVSHAGGLDHG